MPETITDKLGRVWELDLEQSSDNSIRAGIEDFQGVLTVPIGIGGLVNFPLAKYHIDDLKGTLIFSVPPGNLCYRRIA